MIKLIFAFKLIKTRIKRCSPKNADQFWITIIFNVFIYLFCFAFETTTKFLFFYINRVYAIRVLLAFIQIIRILILLISRLFVNKTIKSFIIDFVLWFFKQFQIVMKIIKLFIIAHYRVIIVTFKFIILFVFFEFKIVFKIFVIFVLMININRAFIAFITFHYFFCIIVNVKIFFRDFDTLLMFKILNFKFCFNFVRKIMILCFWLNLNNWIFNFFKCVLNASIF